MGVLRLGLLAIPPTVYAVWGTDGLLVMVSLAILVPMLCAVILVRAVEGGFGLKPSTRALLDKILKTGSRQSHSHDGNGGEHGHSHDDDVSDDGHEHLGGAHGHSHSWTFPPRATNAPPTSSSSQSSQPSQQQKTGDYVSKSHPPQVVPRTTLQKLGQYLHAYVYGRWTPRYLYLLTQLIVPFTSKEGRQRWADTYHGKVVRFEDARAMVADAVDVPAQDLTEQVIPYPIARNIVLSPDKEVVVLDCPCRRFRENPCKPIDVCLLIGKNHDWILEHNLGHSRRITKDEALKILRSEHRRGHVHTAYFKDACNDSFFALCNCCRCCCGGLEMMTKYGVGCITSSGYVAKVEVAKCQNCNTCELTCPFGAITMRDGHSVVDAVKCMGCGACEARCPNKAISLQRDESKPKPLDIHALAKDW